MTLFADSPPLLACLIARRPPGSRTRVPVAIGIALLVLLATPVAAGADHITPGY